MTGAQRHPSAAVVTVGTELTTGLRVDTNTAEVAAAITAAGMRVVETTSVPDDPDALTALLARLTAACDVVVVTGGLGPTHDDVTREAAAEALGLDMVRDPAIEARLARAITRHRDPEAVAQIVRQADVLAGAEVLSPTVGTAPGQVVATPSGGLLVLLPGPPSEMRPMLAEALASLPGKRRGATRVLASSGASESDIQVAVQRVLGSIEGIGFTVLAKPTEVHTVLTDEGVGAAGLAEVADEVRAALGDICFSDDGRTLAEVVLGLARECRVTLGTAESCTGGMVAAALTDVAGSSDVFRGSIVSYADEVKESRLGVPHAVLETDGAVSEMVARAMAEGARSALGVDMAVAVTGIAGPGGGSDAKPVGTVWFAVADDRGTIALLRNLFGDRAGVRVRATMTALDLVRRRLAGLPIT
jgi:nicotinamide-nucleotide amidase